MSKEIPIPPEMNIVREVRIRGEVVRGALSLFDFPRTAEATFSRGTQEFSITFKYPGGDEPTEEHYNDARVTLRTGRRSGRLFQVVVRGVPDTSSIPKIVIEAIVKIQAQATEEPASPYPYMQWLNYAVAKDFVDKNRAALLVA